jgi:hypothetical protein
MAQGGPYRARGSRLCPGPWDGTGGLACQPPGGAGPVSGIYRLTPAYCLHLVGVGRRHCRFERAQCRVMRFPGLVSCPGLVLTCCVTGVSSGTRWRGLPALALRCARAFP